MYSMARGGITHQTPRRRPQRGVAWRLARGIMAACIMRIAGARRKHRRRAAYGRVNAACAKTASRQRGMARNNSHQAAA